MKERDNFVNNVYADAFYEYDYELKWFESYNDSDTGNDASVQFKRRDIRTTRSDEKFDNRDEPLTQARYFLYSHMHK